ncbi:hypothetical protein OH76DRAFT_1320897, partial [Lentinus brumalis]
VSKEFDQTTFSPQHPLDIEFVPWPVLYHPRMTHFGDICWQNIEAFFEVAKKQLTPKDYATLVSTSHKRFHPDRWASRK